MNLDLTKSNKKKKEGHDDREVPARGASHQSSAIKHGITIVKGLRAKRATGLVR